MTTSRFVSRGSKTRFVAYGCVLLVLCALVYVFHGTQSQLEDVLKDNDRLSKRLQMLAGALDSKLKLEKSLNAEKEKLKEELDNAVNTAKKEKDLRDSEKADLQSQYNMLNSRVVSYQTDLDDLQKEMAEIKEKNNKLEAKITALNTEHVETMQAKENEILKLKNQLQQCKKSTENENVDVQHNKLGPEAGEMEDKVESGLVPVPGNNSTSTPVINPQAIGHDEAMKQSLKTSTAPTLHSKDVNSNVLAAPIPNVDEQARELNVGLGGDQRRPEPSIEAQESAVNAPSPDENLDTFGGQKPKAGAEPGHDNNRLYVIPAPEGGNRDSEIRKQTGDENVKLAEQDDKNNIDDYNDDGDFPMDTQDEAKKPGNAERENVGDLRNVPGVNPNKPEVLKGDNESVMVQPKK